MFNFTFVLHFISEIVSSFSLFVVRVVHLAWIFLYSQVNQSKFCNAHCTCIGVPCVLCTSERKKNTLNSYICTCICICNKDVLLLLLLLCAKMCVSCQCIYICVFKLCVLHAHHSNDMRSNELTNAVAHWHWCMLGCVQRKIACDCIVTDIRVYIHTLSISMYRAQPDCNRRSSSFSMWERMNEQRRRRRRQSPCVVVVLRLFCLQYILHCTCSILSLCTRMCWEQVCTSSNSNNNNKQHRHHNHTCKLKQTSQNDCEKKILRLSRFCRN